MTSLELFQDQHGAQWAGIVKTPAFLAALQLLNVEKIQRIAQLSDADIETSGKLLLADLRGHLAHEDNLLTLHSKKEFKFTELGEPSYPSPIDEFNENLDPTQAA